MKQHDFFPMNLVLVLHEKSFQGKSWTMNDEVGDSIVLQSYSDGLTRVIVKITEKLVGPAFGVSPGMTEYKFELVEYLNKIGAA